jgi:tellurite methyltransferase
MTELVREFGEIDIYLFDQLLKGRITPEMRVLDAGCGGGRNLIYLLRQGYEVFGVDQDEMSVAEVQRVAAVLAPKLGKNNFRTENIEQMSLPNEFADVVICSAVLHFARNDKHFEDMLKGLWRVLNLGGLLFCRRASSIGSEHQIQRLQGRRFRLADGSERYLVDEELLARAADELGGVMIDPLKTTVVQNERSMTTWVVRKGKRPYVREG